MMRALISTTLMYLTLTCSLAGATHSDIETPEIKHLVMTEKHLVEHCVSKVDIQASVATDVRVTLALMAKAASKVVNGSGCCGQNDWNVVVPGFEGLNLEAIASSEAVDLREMSKLIRPNLRHYLEFESHDATVGLESIGKVYDADSNHQFEDFRKSGSSSFNLELYLRAKARVALGSTASGQVIFAFRSDNIEIVPNTAFATPAIGAEYFLDQSEPLYKIPADFDCLRNVRIHAF